MKDARLYRQLLFDIIRGITPNPSRYQWNPCSLQVFVLRLNYSLATLWMRGFKGIDLLPLKVLLDSTHFKYPFILQRPRAAFSLWRHRRLVSFLSFPPSNIYRVCQLCVTLPSEACSTKNTSENNKTSLYKVSGFVSEAFCRCGGVQSAGLIRGMSPLKGRPTAVCRFFPPPQSVDTPRGCSSVFLPDNRERR